MVRAPKPVETYDAIVLGAGGAGLMCAGVAGQRGKRVLVIDHNKEPGRKILISGGGRCNFTNLGATAENFLSANPHFAKSALSRFTVQDFIDLVDAHGIAWHEKTLGQLFCDGSAKQIVRMLLDECPNETVQFEFGDPVAEVVSEGGSYRATVGGRRYEAAALVVATGGPSIPKLGATGFAYELAKHFKLKLIEPRPGLVPFTLGREDALFRDLSGVAIDTRVACRDITFREASLFTHKGLSGPAMLQISSYWSPGDEIVVDFLPEEGDGWLRERKQQAAAKSMIAILREKLPSRLAEALLEDKIWTSRIGAAKDKELARLERKLARWPFRPAGTEGFAKAEVTTGGVSTDELSSRTMEVKGRPGLYFIGEAVDVTGWLGGYNFQWAWSSGAAAGRAL